MTARMSDMCGVMVMRHTHAQHTHINTHTCSKKRKKKEENRCALRLVCTVHAGMYVMYVHAGILLCFFFLSPNNFKIELVPDFFLSCHSLLISNAIKRRFIPPDNSLAGSLRFPHKSNCFKYFSALTKASFLGVP